VKSIAGKKWYRVTVNSKERQLTANSKHRITVNSKESQLTVNSKTVYYSPLFGSHVYYSPSIGSPRKNGKKQKRSFSSASGSSFFLVFRPAKKCLLFTVTRSYFLRLCLYCKKKVQYKQKSHFLFYCLAVYIYHTIENQK
jgi:hypothetical protein